MNKFDSLTTLISAYMKKINTGDVQKDFSFEDVRTVVCETIPSISFKHLYGILTTTPNCKTVTMVRDFGYVEN